MGVATMENSMAFPKKKLKIELPYDSAIPLLDIYLENNVIQEDTYTPVFTAALNNLNVPWQ